MKLARYLLLLLSMTATCGAELPDLYRTADRVTWIVENIDQARKGWVALGLSDIEEYPNIKFSGVYHGKPVELWAWQITGHLGNLTVDMIQPAEGELNAFADFQGKHGDGIFSIVHRVASRKEMAQEIQRMRRLGVPVLQQITADLHGRRVIYTYFDTEPRGKFSLGLIYSTGGTLQIEGGNTVSHLSPVVHQLKDTSVFWEGLGFPSFRMEHATPREDSRYRGHSLALTFDVGYQHYDQFSYEWISSPSMPPNVYADFLKKHGEGIQHIGLVVADLDKTVAGYQKLGYRVWQSGAWGDVGKADSGQYAYMDTDSIGGVSVELIHAYK
jgi:Glyoxalase/Bleomycin resistance protein/Dioxygenase superfamily